MSYTAGYPRDIVNEIPKIAEDLLFKCKSNMPWSPAPRVELEILVWDGGRGQVTYS